MYDKLLKGVEKNADKILKMHDFMWKNPETGYKEWKCSARMGEAFEELGYTVQYAGNIPGFYTVIDTGRPGPEVLVLGELDALVVASHPDADKETGAVHSCGHSAQSAALYGVACALKEEGALDGLCGKIKLCAVPAEEHIEIEFRRELRKQGIIKYYGGKSEFLARGYFDTSDVALMIHTSVGERPAVTKGSVGFISKQVIYKGKACHAAGPQNGINALYAANLGLNAINALRETFTESDIVRVHPIITQGGTVVNAIPETVKIESYVRAKTNEAMKRENDKVNRALVGSALALGANVEIIDAPGYEPNVNDDNMRKVAYEASKVAFGEYANFNDNIGSGSTDMGDISAVMPTVHPYCPGATGTGHGNNYCVADPVMACVNSAKWQAVMVAMLLENEGALAKKAMAEYQPVYKTKQEYCDNLDAVFSEGDRIEYGETETKIKL